MGQAKKYLRDNLYNVGSFFFVIMLSIIVFIITIQGIDYGKHWDEHKLLNSIVNVTKTGIILPGWYNYPSFSFLLTLLSSSTFILFELLNDIVNIEFDREFFISLSEKIQVLIEKKNSELINHIRIYFCFFTFLSAPILFLACKLIMKPICAILASVLLLYSFQFVSHSIWIAPDALQVTWISLIIYMMLLYIKSFDFKYLLLMTIFCAAMTSTKYPAGIFLITPIYLLNYKHFLIKKSLLILIIFTISFILISPGILLDPLRFVGDLKFEILHYSKMGHSVYTVKSGIPHFFQLISYITGSLFSPYFLVSIMTSILVFIGIITSLKANRTFLCLILPSLFYLIYFSNQTVMVVRNILILLPIFIFFALYAINKLIYKNKINKIIILLISIPSFLFSILFFNESFISLNKKHNYGYDAYNYIIKSEKKIIISKKVKNLLIQKEFAKEHNFIKVLNSNKINDHKIIYFLSDQNFQGQSFFKSNIWREHQFANIRGGYKIVSGPKDINLDFYPSWQGRDRIMTINIKLTKPFFKYIIKEGYFWKK